jgi:hypothetical protein
MGSDGRVFSALEEVALEIFPGESGTESHGEAKARLLRTECASVENAHFHEPGGASLVGSVLHDSSLITP